MRQTHTPGRKSITLPATYALLSATKKTLAKIENMIYTDDQEDDMKQLKHTPRPWIVDTCHVGESCWCRIINSESQLDEDGDNVNIISDGSLRENNARLIAAAPDMLDALIDYCNEFSPEMRNRSGSYCYKFKDIIQKATGYTWQELTESNQ